MESTADTARTSVTLKRSVSRRPRLPTTATTAHIRHRRAGMGVMGNIRSLLVGMGSMEVMGRIRGLRSS